ncbi:nitroreductase family protein [Alysiella filiformis]|uniref:Putative NAD(P)H nitroreductase n=1 Tax=Alysiella filiformis DSM 16848 TaxID=1120981 RepID=A0A286EFG8_9NEIS|nr:nitroreductase family protein [Alysiella filiformis]QMT30659.1 nitroreductase family protein [Alysiella filiformis]UBQ56363.1 nitroreductase family protein [Alysiella filiformis DSM 16848]SOD69650.1 Nitroreductase [Alysiella filiformis DSM 16848]
MNALELLTTRRSTKTLGLPVPDELQLHTILQAASQVPDHGRLTPWRFVVIQSEAGMSRFRQILLDTVTELNMGDEARAKAEKVGKMAPMVLAVIASPKTGKPEWEQHLSAGCAAYAAQLAANAQGFDNVWLSGLWVNSPLLKAAFDCNEKEKIIALIMLGTATRSPAEPKNTDVQAFTQFW